MLAVPSVMRTRPSAQRRAHQQHRHHIDEGGHDRQPVLARMRHQHQALEIDPETRGRLDAEVGHADDRAPRTGGTRPLQQAERQRGGVDDAVGAARGERPAGQQVGECGVGGQLTGVELVALHAPDARLQFAHDVALASRESSARRARRPRQRDGAARRAGVIAPVSNIRSIVSMTTDVRSCRVDEPVA